MRTRLLASRRVRATWSATGETSDELERRRRLASAWDLLEGTKTESLGCLRVSGVHASDQWPRVVSGWEQPSKAVQPRTVNSPLQILPLLSRLFHLYWNFVSFSLQSHHVICAESLGNSCRRRSGQRFDRLRESRSSARSFSRSRRDELTSLEQFIGVGATLPITVSSLTSGLVYPTLADRAKTAAGIGEERSGE